MVSRALCVGINDYPIRGMDLKGCVNDANGVGGRAQRPLRLRVG